MAERVLSESERRWLVQELGIWQNQALITNAQMQAILALYETPAASAARQKSWGIFVLMSLAALMVGLALLLVIGYNWEYMPAPFKLAIIFTVIGGTHAFAFHLRYRWQARTLSEIAFFLGCIFFGAGIALVAQIFHLNAHYPDGIWWWALGVLPFALCLDTLLLHTLLVALLAIWAGTEVLGFNNIGGWFFGRWPIFPNGAYTLPLLAAPGLWWAYRKESAWTVSLYVPVLAWWAVLQPFAWRWELNPIFFIGVVGGIFLLLAENHRPGSPLAIPYRFYGVVLSLGVLIPLSFRRFQADFFRGSKDEFYLTQAVGFFLLAVVVVGVTVMAKMWQQRMRVSIVDLLVDVARRQWLALGIIAYMVFYCLWAGAVHSLTAGDRDSLLLTGLPALLANAFMVAAAFWLIRLGLREDRGRPFAAGVLYFLLWTVLRYIDLFGEIGGMLGAAAMFFLSGAALFGVAMYWKRRKEIHHA